jgi:hypothetical protein
MLGPLSYQLALELQKDRLRAADRRRTITGPRERTTRAPNTPSR